MSPLHNQHQPTPEDLAELKKNLEDSNREQLFVDEHLPVIKQALDRATNDSQLNAWEIRRLRHALNFASMFMPRPGKLWRRQVREDLARWWNDDFTKPRVVEDGIELMWDEEGNYKCPEVPEVEEMLAESVENLQRTKDADRIRSLEQELRELRGDAPEEG